MVVIIIHIADITCLLTIDGWHAYDVIGVYKILHGAGRDSYFTDPAILWLAGTVIGVVGPVTFNGASNIVGGSHGYGRGRGPCQGGGWGEGPSPLAKRTRPLVIKNIILINQYAHVH